MLRLSLPLIAAAMAFGNARAADDEDWAAARKASCQDLVDAYRTTTAAEKKVAASIKSSKDGTVAGNVLGVATLAAFGVGFFSWDDNASAEENLADLRHDIDIIKTVAAEKKCALPAL
ncbi:MAG: hypothetical protein ACM30H_02025 [Clostridia bacterium]